MLTDYLLLYYSSKMWTLSKKRKPRVTSVSYEINCHKEATNWVWGRAMRDWTLA